MAVSEGFREYALEQLGQVASVTARSMFGGVGIYAGGLFFALMDDDTLYFKVDAANRDDYVRRGMGPFMPFGEGSGAMQYYEVPAEVLEDSEALREWVARSLAVARRAKAKSGGKRAGRAGAKKRKA